MFLFTRQVLHWRASDYGIWVTYKNLLATLGELHARANTLKYKNMLVDTTSHIMATKSNFILVRNSLQSLPYPFCGKPPVNVSSPQAR